MADIELTGDTSKAVTAVEKLSAAMNTLRDNVLKSSKELHQFNGNLEEQQIKSISQVFEGGSRALVQFNQNLKDITVSFQTNANEAGRYVAGMSQKTRALLEYQRQLKRAHEEMRKIEADPLGYYDAQVSRRYRNMYVERKPGQSRPLAGLSRAEAEIRNAQLLAEADAKRFAESAKQEYLAGRGKTGPLSVLAAAEMNIRNAAFVQAADDIRKSKTISGYRRQPAGPISALSRVEAEIRNAQLLAEADNLRADELSRRQLENLEFKKRAQRELYSRLANGTVNYQSKPAGPISALSRAEAEIRNAELVRAADDARKAQGLSRSSPAFQAYLERRKTAPRPLAPLVQTEIDAQIRREQALQQVEKTTKAIQKQKEHVQELAISWHSIGRIVAVQLLHRAVFSFVYALKDGIRYSVEFEKRLAEIQTIASGGASTDQWFGILTKISNQYGIDLTDQATAAYEALSNQVIETATNYSYFGNVLSKFAIITRTTAKDAGDLIAAAMQSFNLPLSDAESIAASFFKTIDLGRIRANELSQSMGKLNIQAGQLGMTLNEVQALMTLNVKGVKIAEWSTQLRGMITAFLKPSDSMKEIFKGWGVDTGEQAQKLFGTIGLLQKVAEAAGHSPTLMAELFPNQRGMIGAVALTKELETVKKNLDEITKSQESYNQAADYFNQNAGQTLNETLTRISNTFKEEGRSLVGTLAKISTELGSNLPNAVMVLVKVFEGALIPAMLLAAGTAVRLTVTLAQTPFGLAAIAITAISTAFMMATESAKAAQKAIDEAAQASIDAFQKETLRQEKMQSTELEKIKSASDERLHIWGQESASRTTMIQNQITELAKGEDKLLEKIQYAAKQTIKANQDVVDSHKRASSDYKNQIEENEKALAKLRTKTEEKNFTRSLAGMTGIQKVIAYSQRAEMYAESRKTAAQSGNSTDFQEASGNLESVNDARWQLIEEAINAVRRRDEQASRRRRRGGRYTGPSQDEQQLMGMRATVQQQIADAVEEERDLRGQLINQLKVQKFYEDYSARIAERRNEELRRHQQLIENFDNKRKTFKTKEDIVTGYNEQRGSLQMLYDNTLQSTRERYNVRRQEYLNLPQDENVRRLYMGEWTRDTQEELARVKAIKSQIDNTYTRQRLEEENLRIIEERNKTLEQLAKIDADILTSKQKSQGLYGQADEANRIQTEVLAEVEKARASAKTMAFGSGPFRFSSRAEANSILNGTLSQVDLLRNLRGRIDTTKTPGATLASNMDMVIANLVAGNTPEKLRQLAQDEHKTALQKSQERADLIKKLPVEQQFLAANFNVLGTIFEKVGQDIVNAILGKPIGGRAYGGLIHEDTVHAMLSPGEYVVNRNASQKFRSQLFTMNHGLIPFGQSNAGDSFSFGNIYVDARGRENGEQIAAEIHSTMRNKIRRGEWLPLS